MSVKTQVAAVLILLVLIAGGAYFQLSQTKAAPAAPSVASAVPPATSVPQATVTPPAAAVPSGTSVPEAPSANQVIDRYLANLAQYGKYDMKFRTDEKDDVSMRGFPQKNGLSEVHGDTEVLFDGTRYHILRHLWGDVLSTTEHRPEDLKSLSSYLFDGSRSMSYTSADNPRLIGILLIQDSIPPEKVTDTFNGILRCILLGSLTDHNQTVGTVLKASIDQTQASLQDGKVQLEAKTPHGLYRVIFDPDRGYNIVGAEVLVSAGDVIIGNPTPAGYSMRSSLTNVRLEKNSGIWMPVEADYSIRRYYPREDHSHSDIHIWMTDMKVSPDFDKLRAFEPSEVKEGARARVVDPEKIQTPYVWRNGKIELDADRQVPSDVDGLGIPAPATAPTSGTIGPQPTPQGEDRKPVVRPAI